MLKKTLLFFVALIIIASAYYHELLGYGWMQAKGQAEILLNTQPIDEVLNDKSFPDSLKVKLRLIEEIKKFAIDSLQLDASNSYT